MAVSNREITDLICSLTPKEKQNFKAAYGGDFDFILMFDYINRNKHFDGTKIKKILSGKGGGSKIRNITPGHLAVIKKYLKEKILESLRIQYGTKVQPFDHLTRTLNTDILTDKRLYSLARRELEVAKKEYFENSFPIEQLMILRRESLLNFYDRYGNTDMDEIIKFCEVREDSARQLLLEVRMANALTILSAMQNKGLTENFEVQKYFSPDYFPKDVENLSFAPKYLYFWTKALIGKFQNDKEAVISCFSEAVKIWIENPAFIERYPKMYLGTCFTYLEILQKQGRGFEELLKAEHFEYLLKKVEAVNLPDSLRRQYHRLFLLNLTDSLVRNLQFNEVINLENQIRKNLNETKYLSDFEKIIFSFYMGYSYFNKGNFDKVFEWLNPRLENKELNYTENPQFYSLMILLRILTHYEMGNLRFLKYELTKSKTLLKKRQLLGQFENAFFDMMSKLTGKRYEGKTELVMVKSLESFQIFEEKGNYNEKCHANHVRMWIEQKRMHA